jgi:quercetin dioxygenase-like cupin family protein
MPLQRIRAASLGIDPAAAADSPEGDPSAVDAEGLNLSEGRTMLNRRVDSPTALIVARGKVGVGVSDDSEELGQGDGVLLPGDTVYSLQASEESLVLLFKLSEPPATAPPP